MRTIKRIFAALVVLAMLTLCFNVFAAGKPTYVLTNGGTSPGKTFTVNLSINNNPGVIAVQLKIIFDPAVLTLVSVSDKGLLQGFVGGSSDKSSPYILFWRNSLSKTDNKSNGVIATLTFRVNTGFTYKESTISATPLDAFNTNLNPVTFAYASARAFVLPPNYNCAFQDVRITDWFYGAVAYTYKANLFEGINARTFDPYGKMTRAMLVSVLWRLEGAPAASGQPFSDVKTGQWYTQAVAWAKAHGIVSGKGNGTFAPTDTVTREQLAQIFYKYAVYKNDPHSARSPVSAFSDSAKISSWALDAVRFAVAAKLLQGTTLTTISPKGVATRAEVAIILARYDTTIAN